MLAHPATPLPLWAMHRNTIIKYLTARIIAVVCLSFLISFLSACKSEGPSSPTIDRIEITRAHLHYSTDLSVTLTEKAQIDEFLALIDGLELRMPKTFWERAEVMDGAGLDYFTLMSDGEIVTKYLLLGERYIKHDEKEFWPMMSDEDYQKVHAFMEKYASWDQLD